MLDCERCSVRGKCSQMVIRGEPFARPDCNGLTPSRADPTTQLILAALEEHGALTSRQLINLTHKSLATIQDKLQRLKSEQRVRVVALKSGFRYAYQLP